MHVERKTHNSDVRLLRRAQRARGTSTETETIHEALRTVVLGEHLVAALRRGSGRVRFRPAFVEQMRRERDRRP